MRFLKVCSQRAQHPICVLHLRGVPRAIRVGLPNSDIPRHNAVGRRFNLVVSNLRVTGIAQESRMNERKMPYIQKILNDSGPCALKG